MSIEKIQGKTSSYSEKNLLGKQVKGNRTYLGNIQDTTSFTGTAKASKTLSEFLLNDVMPSKIKFMVNIHKGMGEIQNQIINAIGTGMIAPLFIKYNPVSKKDEDTRTYTAWRQPVSAVLAVGTQTAIVVPFNSLIRKLSDVGYFSMDKNASLFPSEKFMKAEVLRRNPQKSFSKDEMKEAVKQLEAEYNTKLLNMIKEDKITFNTTDGKTIDKLDMPKEDFKKLFQESLDEIIKEEKDARHDTIINKQAKKIERGIFFHEYPEESTTVLQRLKNTISQEYGREEYGEVQNQVKRTNNAFKKECKTIIADLTSDMKKNPAKKYQNTELINIVKEIANKRIDNSEDGIRILDEKIDKMLDSINTMRTKKTTQEIGEYIKEIIDRRTNAIDKTIEVLSEIKEKLNKNGITVNEAQKIVDKAIAESESSIITKLRAQGLGEKEIENSIEMLESASTRLSEKAGSIATNISAQLKKHVKSNIDGLRRWTGLGVSLAILPATCWMLNKIYPWFMDIAFPELSNKAASAKNNKKVEVK